MKHPQNILDYSSPAQEQTRERTLEEERREAVEAYNESTFGERRPIQQAFVRFAVFLLIQRVIAYFLPRGIVRLLEWLVVAAFMVWQVRTEGWRVARSSFRQPWRWW